MMETVWLHANGRDWHVEVDSAAHERLVLEGAEVVPGPDGPVGPVSSDEVPLKDRKRGELDALAVELGVDAPDKLPNRGAVVEAIEAKQAENDTEDELG